MGGVGQRVVLVLGMHRSGTSVITRGLSALGVALGDDLMPPSPDNPRGYWEDAALNLLNERVLAAIGRAWDSVAPVSSEVWNLPSIQALKLQAVETVRKRFGQFPLWGFKDPRVARLLPFWQDVLRHLGLAETYVVVIRNPMSVARSVAKRDAFALEKSYILWLQHCLEAYEYTRGSRRIVLDYDEFMIRPTNQLRRVAETLDLPLGDSVEQDLRAYTEGFLDNSLRHSIYEPIDISLDIHAPQAVSETYGVLRAVALDELDAESDDVRCVLSSARSNLDAFGAYLSYSEGLEKERNSARRELDDIRCRSTQLTSEIARLQEVVTAVEAESNSQLQERAKENAELADQLQRVDLEVQQEAEELQRVSAKAQQAEQELQQKAEELGRMSGELETERIERRAFETLAQSLKAEKQSLALNNYALKRRLELGTDANTILRSELHNLWNSWSWQLLRPFRNFVRRRQGLGDETEPVPVFELDAIHTIVTIRQSWSWELTMPFRLIYRLLPLRRTPQDGARVRPRWAGGPFGAESVSHQAEVSPTAVSALPQIAKADTMERCSPASLQSVEIQAELTLADSGEESPARIKPQSPRVKRFPLPGHLTVHPALDNKHVIPLNVSVSVIIPTFNAGAEFYWLVRKLFAQKGLRTLEIIAVDSTSTDGTDALARELGCKVIQIEKSQFSHSYARNLGAESAVGDLLLFMVQDAFPVGDYWLYGLASCLLNPGSRNERLAAVSCAEFPRSDSELLYNALVDTHSKFLGCREGDRIGGFAGEGRVALHGQGQLSDIACLIPRSLFEQYRYRGDYAEDLILGIRLIRDGYKVGMLSSIKVIHSHKRPSGYYVRRVFVDVVFLADVFPDFKAPATTSCAATLAAAFALRDAIRQIEVSLTKTPAAAVGEIIATIKSQRLPGSIVIPSGRGDFGYPPLGSWIERVAERMGRSERPMESDEQKDANQLREIFVDRLSGLRTYVGSTYTVLDETVASELNDAVDKTLVMSLGAQLAFIFLTAPTAPVDACQDLIPELRTILTAGI